MPLNIETLDRLSEKELSDTIAAIPLEECELERRKVNDYISKFPTVDDEGLHQNYLAALSRLCSRCRSRQSGPPRREKPTPRPKGPKASTEDLLADL